MTEPRKYEQRTRAVAANQTKQRILDAVHESLSSAPSEPLSLDVVAKSAGVTRPTIYSIFGSRGGLFTAAGDDLLIRAGFADVLTGAAHPNARIGLSAGLEGVVRTYASQRDVFRALFSMAQLDASSFGGAIQGLERGRASGMADLAQRLHSQGYLRPDVDAATATDALWLLTSFDSFDLLYTGRQLDTEATTSILIAMADRTVIN